MQHKKPKPITRIAVGARVRLGNVRHEEFRGAVGAVRRVIQSRGVVEVKLDKGKLYDALPVRVEIMGTGART